MFVRTCDSISLGYTPTSGTAGSYGKSMFNHLRNFQTVPKQLHHFPFLPRAYESSSCSTPLPTLVIMCLFYTFFYTVAVLMCVKWYLTVEFTLPLQFFVIMEIDLVNIFSLSAGTRSSFSVESTRSWNKRKWTNKILTTLILMETKEVALHCHQLVQSRLQRARLGQAWEPVLL